MNPDKKIVVRVYRNSDNISKILKDFIEQDNNVNFIREEEVDSQYQDFVIERTLNSQIRSKIKNQPGMTVLTEQDIN